MKTGGLPLAFWSLPLSAISAAPPLVRHRRGCIRRWQLPGTSGSRNVRFGPVNSLGYRTAFGRTLPDDPPGAGRSVVPPWGCRLLTVIDPLQAVATGRFMPSEIGYLCLAS